MRVRSRIAAVMLALLGLVHPGVGLLVVSLMSFGLAFGVGLGLVGRSA